MTFSSPLGLNGLRGSQTLTEEMLCTVSHQQGLQLSTALEQARGGGWLHGCRSPGGLHGGRSPGGLHGARSPGGLHGAQTEQLRASLCSFPPSLTLDFQWVNQQRRRGWWYYCRVTSRDNGWNSGKATSLCPV